ncbi:hypothetical protein WISP_15244 [Willisornis vidua]|uniref:Uncharacterized protein n=1 Tax=Willisornis vidua TaxID=1566151 RepID=A0ABQ9DUG1_9PASS|nr:hypothetical protein WISP_15244 [Willisornis vidua]
MGGQGGAERHPQPLETPPQRAQRGLGPVGSHPGAGSWQDLCPHGETSPLWSRDLAGPVSRWREEPTLEQGPGRTCVPMERRAHSGAGTWQELCPQGMSTLDQPVPEGLTPWKGTHSGAVPEGLTPWKGTHSGAVPEGLIPWKGSQAGAAQEELQPVGRTCSGEVHGELSPLEQTTLEQGRVEGTLRRKEQQRQHMMSSAHSLSPCTTWGGGRENQR